MAGSRRRDGGAVPLTRREPLLRFRVLRASPLTVLTLAALAAGGVVAATEDRGGADPPSSPGTGEAVLVSGGLGGGRLDALEVAGDGTAFALLEDERTQRVVARPESDTPQPWLLPGDRFPHGAGAFGEGDPQVRAMEIDQDSGDLFLGDVAGGGRGLAFLRVVDRHGARRTVGMPAPGGDGFMAAGVDITALAFGPDGRRLYVALGCALDEIDPAGKAPGRLVAGAHPCPPTPSAGAPPVPDGSPALGSVVDVVDVAVSRAGPHLLTEEDGRRVLRTVSAEGTLVTWADGTCSAGGCRVDAVAAHDGDLYAFDARQRRLLRAEGPRRFVPVSRPLPLPAGVADLHDPYYLDVDGRGGFVVSAATFNGSGFDHLLWRVGPPAREP